MTTIFNYETDHGRVMILGDQMGWGHFRPIYVRDCNLIYRELHDTIGDRFKMNIKYPELDDRMDSLKAVEMFKLWQGKYNPHNYIEFGARAHNAGTHWRGVRADEYWSRIKMRYYENRKSK